MHHQCTLKCHSHFCSFWSVSEISHHIETVLSIEFNSWDESAFFVNFGLFFQSLHFRKQDFSHLIIDRNHSFFVLNSSDSKSDCIHFWLFKSMNSLSENIDSMNLLRTQETDSCFQSCLSITWSDDQYHALHDDNNF